MIKPNTVVEIAPKFEAENLRFRTFLKAYADPEELDLQFIALHDELFNGYDCCSCANCCRTYNICFNDADIRRISEHFNLSEERFIEEYLTNSEEGYIIKPPCTFLCDDGKCSINSIKPYECAGFPYTDMPDKIHYLYGVMDFAQSCPIVFEIVGRLKQIYHFRSSRNKARTKKLLDS